MGSCCKITVDRKEVLMTEFKIVQDELQFDEFVVSHPYGHFMKTTAWGKFRVEVEKDEAYYQKYN